MFIASTMQALNHVAFACMGFSWGLKITLYKKAKTYSGVSSMLKGKINIWYFITESYDARVSRGESTVKYRIHFPEGI